MDCGSSDKNVVPNIVRIIKMARLNRGDIVIG